jgi:Flp pilus assembly protein TadG
MKNQTRPFLRRAIKQQDGQVLPWVAFMMMLFLGMSAFVVDVGHAYYCYQELQAATDAAALAGAQQLLNSTAVAVANSYGAQAGNYNSNPNLEVSGANSVSLVPGYPKMVCLNTVKALGVACLAPNDANAIVVKEQAVIPTFFAQAFGVKTMTVSTTSTAAVASARAAPTNIAIILDTTSSMTTNDSNCGAERIVCAENAVQGLLEALYPCNQVMGCGTVTNGVATNPLDQIALFTFPNITVGTASKDFDCSSSNPTIPVYSFPSIPAATGSSYAPTGSTTATYEVLPFESDYKASDAVEALNTASSLSTAVGGGKSGSTTCPGMAAPGGDGTYYAGSIYAAQGALNAQAAAEVAANSNLSPVNVIIILSDGEANADTSKMATKTVGGTTINYNNPWPSGGGATSSITNYPSALDQCQQAVAAANYAKGQGTQIYSVAYGSESSGCTTDNSGPQSSITPCQVMGQMASTNTATTTYFYSDYNQSGSSSTCKSSAQIADLQGIFQSIASNFLLARLIPNGSS